MMEWIPKGLPNILAPVPVCGKNEKGLSTESRNFALSHCDYPPQSVEWSETTSSSVQSKCDVICLSGERRETRCRRSSRRTGE